MYLSSRRPTTYVFNVKLDTRLKLETFFAHRKLRVRKKVLRGTRAAGRTFLDVVWGVGYSVFPK